MKLSNFVMVMIGIVGALALVAFLRPPIITAQQAELSDLSQKIADLEHKIQQLEGILSKFDDATIKQMADELGWQNKKNWRSLQVGMTEAQVKGYLGEPTKIITGVRTLWYYPNIYCGYVSFDNRGHLTGWNEP